MSEEKWTTGPWKPVWNGTIGKYSVQAGKTATYGVFREHDAYLIAAAPDLYAALSAVEWVEEKEDSGWFFCPRCLKYKQFGHTQNCPLNAALKKARGES